MHRQVIDLRGVSISITKSEPSSTPENGSLSCGETVSQSGTSGRRPPLPSRSSFRPANMLSNVDQLLKVHEEEEWTRGKP